jgi:hypothetical protein
MLPVWPYTVQFLQLFKVVVREGYNGHLYPIEARCLIASPLLPNTPFMFVSLPLLSL